MSTLKINNLSKTYPNGVKALDNVSIEIENGMFGLLGPNGAGKSSLMRSLATLQEVDSGTAIIGDIDILNQSLEALNVIKEELQDNEELFSKLIEVIQSKGKINEAFFIPVQER